MPQVDVVVPSYNYGRYLEGCISSLLGQRGIDVRVLVIDDASTDATPEIGERLSATDRRVTFRRHTQNLGHIATYNEGLLGWASGDYVLLISADDLVAPGALLRAVERLEEYPDASFACGRQISFEEVAPDLTEEATRGSGGYRIRTSAGFIAEVCQAGQNPVATPTALVRTPAQQAVGGYDPALPHTADLEMWLRLAARGTVIELDAVQAFKRHHGRNMQLAYVVASQGDILERLSAFKAFFERFGALVPTAGRDLERATEALATELFWRGARLFDTGQPLASLGLIRSAADMYPPITHTSNWRRMALKRQLGYRLWSMIQVLTGRGEQCA